MAARTKGKMKQVKAVPSKKKRGRMALGSMDLPLFFSCLLLIIFGVFMVYSASAPLGIKLYGNPQYFFKQDIKYAVLAVAAMLFASIFDYHHYRKAAPFFYGLALLACLMVFVPGLGQKINNARRWVKIRSFTFQPSDFMKPACLLYLSAVLSSRPLEENASGRILFRFLLLLALTLLPVYLQPNLSTTVILGISLVSLYIMGGMGLKQLGALFVLAIVAFTLVFWPKPGNYRLERLLTMFNPSRDPQGSGWQLLQSLYAVSSGGLFGLGYGQSRQKYDYLAAEPHNDFIFSVFCEEFGFIGALLLILFYCYLIYRCLRIASQAPDSFGRLLGYGFSFLIASQSLVNMGVAIGFMPPTGVTLPFISYGGTSLLVMSMMVGILLNISRQGRTDKT